MTLLTPLGSWARQTQFIQPGCTYLAISQDPGGARAGYAGAVPAGAQFTLDPAWHETQILGRKVGGVNPTGRGLKPAAGVARLPFAFP
jgi:hypothetical protein